LNTFAELAAFFKKDEPKPPEPPKEEAKAPEPKPEDSKPAGDQPPAQ
jgi:hypothetical protein